MLSANQLIRERLNTLSLSIEDPAVTNTSLTDTQHNKIARMLRNGLAVVSFNALEDYIKSRTSEVLSNVGSTGIPFNKLPEKLQFASTCDAVKALTYQLNLIEKPERIAYIQYQALKISSTANSTYELFPHAFGYDMANLKDDTVREILKSFLIEQGWAEMSKLSSRIGLSALPLDEVYKSAMSRRNKAAHEPHTDIPQNDIKQFINDAYAISISFDCLLSKAISSLSEHNPKYLDRTYVIKSDVINIRIIRYVDSDMVWKEYSNNKNIAYRKNPDLEILRNGSRYRAQNKKELFVVFDSNGKIDNWECF